MNSKSESQKSEVSKDSMGRFIDRVCEKPTLSMLDVYEKGGREALKDFNFPLYIPLAVSLSERYRGIKTHVQRSRELELILFDMKEKGYGKGEMLIICTIAAFSDKQSLIAGKFFDAIARIALTSLSTKPSELFFMDDLSSLCSSKPNLNN